MRPVLLDSVAWGFALTEPDRLSPLARDLMASGRLHLSAISFYEIMDKVRRGKWPGMELYIDRLPGLATEYDIMVLPLDGEIATLAGSAQWDHRDPFDRMVWATARKHELPILSCDRKLLKPSIPLGVEVLW